MSRVFPMLLVVANLSCTAKRRKGRQPGTGSCPVFSSGKGYLPPPLPQRHGLTAGSVWCPSIWPGMGIWLYFCIIPKYTAPVPHAAWQVFAICIVWSNQISLMLQLNLCICIHLYVYTSVTVLASVCVSLSQGIGVLQWECLRLTNEASFKLVNKSTEFIP